jgi:SWI/SNF-related matrix-associated actin-dependent regulator 1 of chromatin subfamily A
VAIEKLVGSKRFILADDMGLGKTTSTIIAALETDIKKILIICPASLKINWEREIRNYTDRSVFIAEGKNFSTEHNFVIVNYDILKNFYDLKDKENSLITKGNFDLIIIDEAHYASNSQANRTKLINSFVKDVEYLWLLTGTPMTSRPINYYNLLNLIESPVAQNWMAYVIRYCQGYQFKAGNRKVWNVNGASNLEELRDRTSRQVLRRLKEDVLDLPEKIITPVYLRLKSKEYENVMGEYYEWYNKNPNESKSLTVQFSKLMKVRQVIADEKISNTIEIIENILEQGKKVIVFTNFTDTLQKIHSHFGKQSVYLDGTCTKPQRQYAVDQFQENDKIKVFVGNLQAAGVGITLTAGEAVVFNDLSFVPAHHQQAEDRAYRYGQKNCVSVYYPLFENTIEGVIYDMLINKKSVIDTVMGDNLDKADFIEQIMNRINTIN